jgi:hypothetical protein
MTHGPSAFHDVRVYLSLQDYTLVEWDVREGVQLPRPWTFELQFSRDPGASDWTPIAQVTDQTNMSFRGADLRRRDWSNQVNWYYRVLLIGADSVAYASTPVVAWGSLNAREAQQVRIIYRDFCIRACHNTGSDGLLFRAKHWKIADRRVVDPMTERVIVTKSALNVGTGFDGGYWPPLNYQMELDNAVVSSPRSADSTGTLVIERRVGRGISWPFPRANDLWYQAGRNRFYRIDEVKSLTQIRDYPILIQVVMYAVPYTDIVYQLPLPAPTGPDTSTIVPV